MRKPGSTRASRSKLRSRETRAGQQHQCQRHLRRDQHPAKTPPPAARTAVAAASLRNTARSGRDATIAGTEPKIDARDERQQRLKARM